MNFLFKVLINGTQIEPCLSLYFEVMGSQYLDCTIEKPIFKS